MSLMALALAGLAQPIAMPRAAGAAEQAGILILAAQFGSLGLSRKLDIAAPLQALCGTSTDCSAFCSETSFGLYRLGRQPICRVAFRCPDQSVHAVEAAKEDLIVMRCEGDLAPAAEDLQQPRYVYPRS